MAAVASPRRLRRMGATAAIFLGLLALCAGFYLLYIQGRASTVAHHAASPSTQKEQTSQPMEASVEADLGADEHEVCLTVTISGPQNAVLNPCYLQVGDAAFYALVRQNFVTPRTSVLAGQATSSTDRVVCSSKTSLATQDVTASLHTQSLHGQLVELFTVVDDLHHLDGPTICTAFSYYGEILGFAALDESMSSAENKYQ